eukprot:scaffold835_cov202-Alexandrium_tamarense.AAC.12
MIRVAASMYPIGSTDVCLYVFNTLIAFEHTSDTRDDCHNYERCEIDAHRVNANDVQRHSPSTRAELVSSSSSVDLDSSSVHP